MTKLEIEMKYGEHTRSLVVVDFDAQKITTEINTHSNNTHKLEVHTSYIRYPHQFIKYLIRHLDRMISDGHYIKEFRWQKD